MKEVDHSDTRCEQCIIRQLNSLRTLTSDQLRCISREKKTLRFKKGETIFGEGERLSGVFCVRSGVTKLSKLSDNGRDQIVKLARKGDVLGQRSMITQEVTNLQATALNEMEICYIPKQHMQDNLQENPNFTNDVLTRMAGELKAADDIIVNMAQKSVTQRVAKTLLFLENTFGTDAEGYIDMTLTRSDIADIVGTSTEPCIRTITKLKKQGLLMTDGKRIKLSQPKALFSLYEGL
jgi:CRP-like cAMP-binding protein